IAPLDFSLISFVQNGCSYSLYCSRLPQAPTTFSEVLGMSWAAAPPAARAVAMPIEAAADRPASVRLRSRVTKPFIIDSSCRSCRSRSEDCESAVLQIGDQHVAGCMGDAELGLDRCNDRLRRDAAGPE